MRKLFLALFVAGAALASASTFVVPHILEKSGSIQGVVYNFEGGWKSVDALGRTGFKESDVMFGGGASNLKLLTLLVDTMNTQAPFPDSDWSFKRLERMGSGIRGTDVSMMGLISEVTFPACDRGSHDPAYLKGALAASEIRPPQNVSVNAAELNAARSSAPWQLAEYSLTVPGVNTRIASVDSFTWRIRFHGVDNDQIVDPGSLSFHVPFSPNLPAMLGSTLPFTMQYVDRGGIVIVLDGTFTVDSVGPDDIFQTLGLGTTTRISGSLSTWHFQRPRYRTS